MSGIQRICPQCGESSDLQARHCPHCGVNLESGLPVQQERALPATLTKAALPILAGAASLVLRASWRLIQSRMAQNAAQQALDQVIKQPPTVTMPRRGEQRNVAHSVLPAQQAKRTIRIRSSWAVGDANGVWQQGASEHTIEFDE